MKLMTHLHLVLRSRLHGAIPPLPQYAFMEWCSVKSTGTTLPFTFLLNNYCKYATISVSGRKMYISLYWNFYRFVHGYGEVF
jgi:hypothetical protein